MSATMMTLVLIHGANATEASWLPIKAHLPHRKIFLNYESTAGFANNLRDMLDTLKGESDLFIIAHSLGGIYALHLHKHLGDLVKGAVTLSTPYGGSRTADWMKYVIPTSKLLREIGTYARPITDAHAVVITCPWTAVISTEGHGNIIPQEPNDGVVTRRSMECRNDMRKVETAANHHEIMLRPQTVAIIQRALVEVFA